MVAGIGQVHEGRFHGPSAVIGVEVEEPLFLDEPVGELWAGRPELDASPFDLFADENDPQLWHPRPEKASGDQFSVNLVAVFCLVAAVSAMATLRGYEIGGLSALQGWLSGR